MDPRHFSLYGNRITAEQDRKALAWQQMFVKKFSYDPNERYELSVHDNPQLGDVLGIRDIRRDDQGDEIDRDNGVVISTIRMGFGHYRIAMAGAIGVAGYLGLNPPGFAAQVVALAFGLAASSIFPVLMMGIFNKKMNREGAIFGMLAGLLSTLIYIFWFKGWFFVPGTEMAANTVDNWLLGISPEAFGAVGALINFGVAWVVSKVTAAPPENIQHLVEDIRVPKGAGEGFLHLVELEGFDDGCDQLHVLAPGLTRQ